MPAASALNNAAIAHLAEIDARSELVGPASLRDQLLRIDLSLSNAGGVGLGLHTTNFQET